MSRPAVWSPSKAADLVVRIFGGDPNVEEEQMPPEELRDLVAVQKHLNPEQRTIMTGALEIRERALREVLVPRRQVTVLEEGLATPVARAILAKSGHSRAPVTKDGHLDDVICVVNLRDVLDDDVKLPHAPPGPYATIAGLVLVLLGRIPEEPGDVVRVSGRQIEVLEIEHHAITQVRLRSQAEPRNDQGL